MRIYMRHTFFYKGQAAPRDKKIYKIRIAILISVFLVLVSDFYTNFAVG